MARVTKVSLMCDQPFSLLICVEAAEDARESGCYAELWRRIGNPAVEV